MLLPLRSKRPQVPTSCYIAPTASLIGDVVLGEKSSIMFNAVLRGDVMPIRIGSETNIQDGVIVHGTYQKCGAVIGDRVSVGHGAILHGCEIGDGCLIGMGAIVMDQAKVGKHCLVAAGSLVTEGSQFEEGQLIMGRPAKVKRALTKDEIEKLEKSADNYLFYQTWYLPEES